VSEPPAIETIDVRKHFDGGVVRALDGVTVQVPRGQLAAIVGPSGSGKSTLLHLLAALDAPTSGSIVVDGNDLSHLRDPSHFRRDQVGLVFQLHNLLPHLTAAQNVEIAMYGTRLSRAERKERSRELLADVDLAGMGDRPPVKLSGGERQRVAIARALANEPPVLLADEPTGSLDRAAVDRVLALFRRLRDERPQLPIVVVTHDQRVADVADRVIRMEDGQVADDHMNVGT
jgi:putative ABC transport system ATP-binding protein